MITYPENNSTVSGVIEVEGTAAITDFGFYKFEISAGESNNWLTIQAGDTPKEEDVLGFWDTTQLDAGNYYLRLVVIDNQGIQRDPCTVYLYVDLPEN
jgi:ribulose bisphosphate carboxylase small subunit